MRHTIHNMGVLCMSAALFNGWLGGLARTPPPPLGFESSGFGHYQVESSVPCCVLWRGQVRCIPVPSGLGALPGVRERACVRMHTHTHLSGEQQVKEQTEKETASANLQNDV